MSHAIFTLTVFIAAVCISSAFGNQIYWYIWTTIADWYKLPRGEQKVRSKIVGILERILYIFAVVIDHYEVAAGWLVMKAFFGWITDAKSLDAKEPSSSVRDLYNEFVIGNILSLLIGLAIGVVARYLIAA